MNEPDGKGGLLNRIALAVSAALLLLILGTGLLLGLSGTEKETLARTHETLSRLEGRRTPNPATVGAWQDYRKALTENGEELTGYLRERDANLDAFFEEFPARTRNWEMFKGIYLTKVKELYEKAKPVLARDTSGMPLAHDAVLPHDTWEGITPTPEQAVPAQKAFWVQQEVVDVLLAMAGERAEGGPGPAPVLLRAETGEAEDRGIASFLPATVTVRLAPGDVGPFVNRLLQSPKRRLLVRLRGLVVEKVESLEESYVHKVKEGEADGFDEQAFLRGLRRPVKLTLTFEVVDLT